MHVEKGEFRGVLKAAFLWPHFIILFLITKALHRACNELLLKEIWACIRFSIRFQMLQRIKLNVALYVLSVGRESLFPMSLVYNFFMPLDC